MGQTGLASIVDGGFAANAGYDGYSTDGNRENDDQRNRLYAAFTQYSPQSGSSVMAEYKHSERDYGDLRRLLDDSLRRATLRQSENVDQYRVGFRHDLDPGSTLIGHYTRRIAFSQARDDGPFTGVQTFGPLRLDTASNDHQIEWQHLWTASNLFSSVCGGGWNGRVDRSSLDFAPQRQQVNANSNASSSGPAAAENATSETRANLYCYGTLAPAARLALTLGLSIDHEENAFRTGAQLDPKLGLRWALAPGTSLRVAAMRTLQRPLANGQTLEPTQMAGFNQFFEDEKATRAWRYGIGLDHRASASLYLGAETSWRDLDFPLGVVGEKAVSGNRAQEWTVRAYGNWTPDDRWALRSEIAFERFTYDLACPSPDDLRRLDTARWTTGARYFLPKGLSLDLSANLLAQTGQAYGGALSCPGTNAVLPTRDARFWVADAALRYRPAESATALALVARNLNDETRGYQETDAGTPRFTVGREVLLLISVDLERAWRNRGLFD